MACDITKHRRKKEEKNIHLLVEKERFQICVENLSAPANMLILNLTIVARQIANKEDEIYYLLHSISRVVVVG